MSTLNENIIGIFDLPILDIPKVVPFKSAISLYMVSVPVMTALHDRLLCDQDEQDHTDNLIAPIQRCRNETANKFVGL